MLMAGKRELQRNRRWIVAALFVALAVALLLWALVNQRLPNGGMNWAALIVWQGKDPTTAAFTYIGDGSGLIGLAIAIYQVLFDRTVERDGDRTRADIVSMEDRVIAAISAAREPSARPLDADANAAFAQAAQSVAERGGEPARLIISGRVQAGFAALRAEIETEEASAREARAARWRELGALLYPVNVAGSIEAYEQAAAVEPNDPWTHIFLSRLHRAGGDLAKARAAADSALSVVLDRRTKSVVFTGIGDLARAQGDLPAARRAYEDSLAIDRDLSARDSGNAEWKRDLSISHNKLGDVARAEGDLPAARKAYEDSLAIHKDLSARDPGNAEWKRDLSVSYNKLGDVAVAEGDLPAARKAYEDSLAIHKDLSARDPGNTAWKRDLSVSYERLGDVARAEGDLPAARKAYEDSLAIRKDLNARDPGNTEWRRDLSFSFTELGDLAEARGDTQAALVWHEQALAIDEVLAAKDRTNAIFRRDAEVSQSRVAALRAKVATGS
jgi:tetratricopeptide (TPR) repeat protein